MFNGNKLWHAITPLEAGAERIVLTMEYVTNPEMGPLHRFVSNMKDAIVYFGISAVLRGGCRADVGAPGASLPTAGPIMTPARAPLSFLGHYSAQNTHPARRPS
jgi:hypothetical protein